MAKKTDWLPYGMLPLDLILKAWDDSDFKDKLLRAPKETLAELGYAVPEDLLIEVTANRKNRYCLVLPEAPDDLKSLSREELLKMISFGTKCAATGTCD